MVSPCNGAFCSAATRTIGEHMTPTKELLVIRERERFRMTAISRVQWWRLEREGKVPRRITLGENSVGWLKSELEGWIAAKAAARD